MRIPWNALIGSGCVVFGAGMLARTPPDFAEAPELARIMIREGRDFAILSMLLGVGILVAPFLDARLGSRRPRSAEGADTRGRCARRAFGLRTLAPLAILPLLLALFVCQDRIRATKTDIVPWPGGERFFWLDDDMMVSMRYAMNFGRGEGLRWNAGEPAVEGYTNFLWTLALAIPHALGAPLRLAAAFPLAVGSAMFAALVALFMALAVRARVAPSLALAGGLALASNRWLVHWTVAGSEVAPMALALLAIHGLATATRGEPRPSRLGSGRSGHGGQSGPDGRGGDDGPNSSAKTVHSVHGVHSVHTVHPVHASPPLARPRRFLALGVLLAAVGLLRADGLVLVAAHAPALALLARRGRMRSRAWPMFAIPAVAVVGHFLFRRAYYGEWMPNTYALKAVGIHMQAPMGFNYAQYLPILMGGACALHLLHAATARRPVERALAVVPWAVALYAAWIGGDELPEMRFVAPVVPLLLLGAVRALDGLVRTSIPWPRGLERTDEASTTHPALRQFIEEIFRVRREGGGNERRTLDLGRLPDHEVRRIQTRAGLDLTGYRRVIDGYGVSHAIRKHGGTGETRRGQAPLEPGHFFRMHEIVSSPDRIVLHETRNNQGNLVLRYEKRFTVTRTITTEERFILLEEIRSKRRSLTLATMWVETGRASLPRSMTDRNPPRNDNVRDDGRQRSPRLNDEPVQGTAQVGFGRGPGSGRPTSALALVVLALATFKTLLLPYAFRDLGAARFEQERRNLDIGLMLRHNTAPDARVAHFWAGAAPYFSERPAIDLLGKCDARIAALPGKPYQWPPGHVKYDMSISLGREPDLGPDVIVSALPLSKLDPATRARDPEAVSYPALHALYDAPEFARYASGAVRLPASEDYHGVFVREGSPRARPAAEWEAP